MHMRTGEPSREAGRRPASGLRALLLALLLAIALAWGLPSGGPSRAELAQALRRAGAPPVDAAAIADLDCTRVSSGQGFDCRWRQPGANGLQMHYGRVGIDSAGWRLIGSARMVSDSAP